MFCPEQTEIELRETQMTYIVCAEISAFSEKRESSWNLHQTRTNISTYNLQDFKQRCHGNEKVKM